MISIHKMFVLSSAILTIRIEKLTDCKDTSAVECSFFLSQIAGFTDNTINNALGEDGGSRLKPKFSTTTMTDIGAMKLENLVVELIKKGVVPVKDILETKVEEYRDSLFPLLSIDYENLCKAKDVTDTSIVLPFVKYLYEYTKNSCISRISGGKLENCITTRTEPTTEVYYAYIKFCNKNDCSATCLDANALNDINIRDCADTPLSSDFVIENNYTTCKNKSIFHCIIFLSKTSIFDIEEENVVLGEKISFNYLDQATVYLKTKSDFVVELLKKGNKQKKELIKIKADEFRNAFVDMLLNDESVLYLWESNELILDLFCKEKELTDTSLAKAFVKRLFEKFNELCPATKDKFNDCIDIVSSLNTEEYIAYVDALKKGKENCDATCPTQNDVKDINFKDCNAPLFLIPDTFKCEKPHKAECLFSLYQSSAFDVEEENNKLGDSFQNIPDLPPFDYVRVADVETAITAKSNLVSELTKFKNGHNIEIVMSKVVDYRSFLLDIYLKEFFETYYWKKKTLLSNVLCKATPETDISVAKPFVKLMFETANAKCPETKTIFENCIAAENPLITEVYIAYYDALIIGNGCTATCPTGFDTTTILKVCGTGGLSTGGIVGIVIGSIVGVVGIAGSVIFFVKKN